MVLRCCSGKRIASFWGRNPNPNVKKVQNLKGKRRTETSDQRFAESHLMFNWTKTPPGWIHLVNLNRGNPPHLGLTLSISARGQITHEVSIKNNPIDLCNAQADLDQCEVVQDYSDKSPFGEHQTTTSATETCTNTNDSKPEQTPTAAPYFDEQPHMFTTGRAYNLPPMQDLMTRDEKARPICEPATHHNGLAPPFQVCVW